MTIAMNLLQFRKMNRSFYTNYFGFSHKYVAQN